VRSTADGDTELAVASDLQHGIRRNALAGLIVGVVAGSAGGICSLALGLKLLGSLFLATGPAAIAWMIFAACGAAGYAAVYRLFLRRFEHDLERLTRSVAAEITLEDSAPPLPAVPRVHHDDAHLALLAMI
jgi:hypothetical protein